MAFSFHGGLTDQEEDGAFSGSGVEIQDLFFFSLSFSGPPPPSKTCSLSFGFVTFFPWGTFHDGKVTGAFSVFLLQLPTSLPYTHFSFSLPRPPPLSPSLMCSTFALLAG